MSSGSDCPAGPRRRDKTQADEAASKHPLPTCKLWRKLRMDVVHAHITRQSREHGNIKVLSTTAAAYKAPHEAGNGDAPKQVHVNGDEFLKGTELA